MAGVNRMRRAPRAPDAGARQARGLVRRDPPAHRLRAEQRRQRGRDRRLGLPAVQPDLPRGPPRQQPPVGPRPHTRGGLLLLHPRQGHDERTGFQRGTADGLWRFAPLIREFGPRPSWSSARTRPTRTTTARSWRSTSPTTPTSRWSPPGSRPRTPGATGWSRWRAAGCPPTPTSPTTPRATPSPTRSSSSRPAPSSIRSRSSPERRARRGSRTSGPRSCRGSPRRAACASTASGATGATWAPSRPTGRPTQTCSSRYRPWTSTTPTGRSPPAPPPIAPRPRSPAGRSWRRAGWRRGAAWREASSAR